MLIKKQPIITAWLPVILFCMVVAAPQFLQAQVFTIDTAKKTMDVFGSVNGATIHLPGVAKQPEYPGGKPAWQAFLRANINVSVPIAHRAPPNTYAVRIRFMVDTAGFPTQIGADSNCGYGLEDEVIRCIKKSQQWIPAETNSKRKVMFTLRTVVKFIVSTTDVKLVF